MQIEFSICPSHKAWTCPRGQESKKSIRKKASN